MNSSRTGRLSALIVALSLLAWASAEAGIRKEIQTDYLQRYKNRAMFLKIPVRGFRQIIQVADPPVIDRSNASQPLSFKVGEQVRITDVKFSGSSVDFRIAALDMSRESEIIFRFLTELGDEFPEKAAFEAALAMSFTEGLSYTEIDSAKETFIKGQFDDLIAQFAAATGTGPDYVIKTISEKNPEYRQAKNDSREARARQQEAEQQLRDEAKAHKDVESDLQSARRELTQAKTTANSLREERGQLASEKSDLQKEITQLQARNQDYDRQVSELVRNLGVQTDSRANLGKRVEAVSRSFDSLRSERSDLSQKLGQVTKELENLRSANTMLTADLKRSQQENSKLSSELHSLTSDRDSLEARYLRTRREREVLDNTAKLTRSLRLEKRREERKEGVFDISDVYLLTKKIATLDVQLPQYPGDKSVATFSVLSPDTVEFTGEERELYGLLGDKMKLNISWATTGDRLKVVSGGKPALQEVAPRERGQWSWQFQGEPSDAERVGFNARLVSKDGQNVALAASEFWIYPTGLWDRAKRAFAPLSFAGGLVLGLGLLGLVWLVRGKASQPGRRRSASEPEYVVQKRL